MTTPFAAKDVFGRVKGLGPSHEGTKHWWLQRITAIALIPLVIWFIISIISVAGLERELAIAWFGHPFSALALVLVTCVGIFHALLGIQVVIEDYIHLDWLRLTSLILVRFIGYFLMGISAISAIVMVFIRFMGTN
ncbi:MAG: succinate dehydrogenase, hydrophobic membrane anchor protein [Alphaproteobacteria bacterium]|nr:succinate dehydrogenase, hydrophobic membrane anchor protein [Alphaproteobacteria bacterium]OJV45342.1 MAG: succinate dehydrogenase, hydrophobic membrane anchor protein [Alphaproteobacteria bacterium 43-37]